jgi:hypothetical protein
MVGSKSGKKEVIANFTIPSNPVRLLLLLLLLENPA